MMYVGIIGAGKGGTSLLKTLHSVPEVQIIGIADLHSDAPGMVLARKYHIPTFSDFTRLFDDRRKKIIIDATGVERVRERLTELADAHTDIVGSCVALLMMKMIESRERLIDQLEEQSGQMANLAGELSETMFQISSASESNVNQLHKSVLSLVDVTQQNNTHLEETHEILNFIKRVSNQTKLLGLNASIEASRAGTTGLGFNVVAGEIRKLADDSAQSTQKINNILSMIKTSTEETSHFVEQIQTNTGTFIQHQEEYSALLEKVADQIAELSRKLAELSQK